MSTSRSWSFQYLFLAYLNGLESGVRERACKMMTVLTLKHQTLNINTDCCWCPMCLYLLFIPILSLSSHGSRDPGPHQRIFSSCCCGAVGGGYSALIWTSINNMQRKPLFFVKSTYLLRGLSHFMNHMTKRSSLMGAILNLC